MENRSSTRVPASGMVRIQFNGRVADAHARDIGLDGMRVELDADWLEPNTAVQVELALPDGLSHRTYRVEAFVVQHRSGGTRLTFANPNQDMLSSIVAVLRNSREQTVLDPVALGALS